MNQNNNADSTSYWTDWQSETGGSGQFLVECEATVPEPSSIVVMGGLFATFGIGMGWRRRKAALDSESSA
jgi:hypothetical protein